MTDISEISTFRWQSLKTYGETAYYFDLSLLKTGMDFSVRFVSPIFRANNRQIFSGASKTLIKDMTLFSSISKPLGF